MSDMDLAANRVEATVPVVLLPDVELLEKRPSGSSPAGGDRRKEKRPSGSSPGLGLDGVVTGKVVEAGFMPAREDVALRWNYLAFSGGFCDEGVLVMEGAIDPGGQAGKVQYFRLVGMLLSSCGGDPSLIVKLLRRKELGKEKREGSVVASGREEEVAGSRKKKRTAVVAVDEDSFSAGVRDHFPDPIME